MKKNMKILILLLFVGLLLSWPMYSLLGKLEKTAEQEQIAAFDKLSEEFLTLTKKGDLDAARQKIEKLADAFPSQALPVSMRIESLNAVTQSILAAKKFFGSTNTADDKLLWHATQVRIAIDALTHTHQPMWRNYYSSYAHQLQNLMHSSVQRDFVEFQAQFAENYRLYLAVKPAMSVQVNEAQMEKISEAYDFLTKEVRKESIDWANIRDTLRELNGVIQQVFVGEDKNAFSKFLFTDSTSMLMFSIGTVVTMTLAYVAWRKYMGVYT